MFIMKIFEQHIKIKHEIITTKSGVNQFKLILYCCYMTKIIFFALMQFLILTSGLNIAIFNTELKTNLGIIFLI